MPDGFWGRILLVDISRTSVEEIPLTASTYRKYLGGYGLGVRLLYDRLPRGTDPLGGENVLGFFPGLLTGAGVPFGGRFMVVGKSPFTGGWGECNCGGHFGPALRSAGFDGLLVTGSSPYPVYVQVEDERVEVREANHLWGLDTAETAEQLKERLGRGSRVVSIGPAGEKRSLIASIITDDGRAAARSGLGAVMGAQRLKAIAVRGSRKLPVSDRQRLTGLSREYARIFKGGHSPLARLIPQLSQLLLPVLRKLRVRPSGGPAQAIVQVYREYGTCFGIPFSTEMGDVPIQNWRGVAARDFPLARSRKIGGDAVLQYQVKRYHCRHCPVGCGGIVRLEGDGVRETRKPEYETLAAFGPLLLNDDLRSIIEIGSMCDRYGLDTISTGVTVAFVLECAEHGLLGPKEADGLELSWGNERAIVELVRRIAVREGIGDLLADGVKRAAERLGSGAGSFAMHVGGQELPMHDARYEPMLGLAYVVDPTPARHNTANGGIFDLPSLREVFSLENLSPGGHRQYEGKGALFAFLNRYLQVVNCSGLCMFSLLMGRPPVREWINAATGWDLDLEDLLRIGHRIQVLRQAFNLREGIRPGEFSLPLRAAGRPPLGEGPLRGTTLDMETMSKEYFQAMEYDDSTGVPTRALLQSLGLPQVADDLKGVCA